MQNNDKTVRTVVVSGDELQGDLVVPSDSKAIILFAHGSGSSRHSTRNQYVAKILNDSGFATLLVDLLTAQEKEIDEETRHLRFDIGLLARRLLVVTEWLVQEPETKGLQIGYFGSSTGAAASLIAAAKLNDQVKAIVCRGGRPDLADSGVLQGITPATLLIVGGDDEPVIGLNRVALKQLSRAEAKELAVIPGAGHLFEEPDKMEEVARIATEWFGCYLLKNGRKFENKYSPKRSGLLSVLRETPRIQIRFKDREAAGDMLASLLGKYKDSDPVIIGIARGGIIVADAIARKLNTTFDIVIPRKLRAQDNSESAIGAIMHDGSEYVDNNATNVSSKYIEKERLEQLKEIDRRMSKYSPDPKEYNIKGRTVILVDDGAATGATIIVAARWIRKQGPSLLVIGLPVAPRNVADLLKAEADDVKIVTIPSTSKFKTVEYFYEDFSPLTDEIVIQILETSRSFYRKN